MTIFEHIKEKQLEYHGHRLKIMLDINAPDILIVPFQKKVDDLKKLKFSDIKNGDLANSEFISVKELKGRGGKPYYIYNDEVVCFTNWGIAFKKKEY